VKLARQISVTVLAVAVALASLALGPQGLAAEEPTTTTIYVVRHAEAGPKSAASADPLLTEFGMAQAADLSALLGSAFAEVPIAAVYSTPYRRTLMTAGPTAGAAGVATMRYRAGARGEAEPLPSRAELLAAHADGAVLIVGHSNTVPAIVAALGGQAGGKIEHDEYNNLFVLELTGEVTRVRRHRYGPLQLTRRWGVTGDVVGQGRDGRDNISGVTTIGDRVIVCSDEGTSVQKWRATDDGFLARRAFDLPTSSDEITELDLEGLAAVPRFLYAIGSHSLRRKRVRERAGSGKRETYEGNRKRLASVKAGGNDERNRLFRIPVDASGKLVRDNAVALDLRPFLEDSPWLRRSAAIPSKENGLDIEAIAVDRDELVLGLRGPVLRGNFAPIVRVRPSKGFTGVKGLRVSFVDLGGAGVRGLARCATGFLLLAGPVGDAQAPHRLYHWDGEDMLPGKRKSADASRQIGRLTLLGTVQPARGGRAEGVALLRETEAAYSILVVYDGAKNGAPTEFRVRKIPGL